MNPLRTIARDLVERKLWPFAALLAAVLVAVPALFLRPTPAALDGAAPAAVAAPAAAAPVSATGPTGPTDVLADPSVGLTSSPFAAAFGEGTKLPPAMQGLLRAAKGADQRKTVADAPLRDPFAAPPGTGAGAAADEVASAAASTTSSDASTPAPAASASGGSAGPVGDTEPTPVESGTTGPVATTTEPATETPVSSAPVESSTKTIYHADVRFGTVETPPMVSDVRRLTAFPSSFEPIAVYLGVMRGGWGAAFALRAGTAPVGAASCRPRKQICTWVILHPGETVTLNVKDETTGAVTPYKLKLERVRKTTVSPEAADLAGRRVSVAGRCLLGPLAAYRYDTESGTLAPRPELKACRYAAPAADGQAAAVRTAHIG